MAQTGTVPVATTFDFGSSRVKVHVGEVLAFQPIVAASNGLLVGEEIGFNGAPNPYSRGWEREAAVGSGQWRAQLYLSALSLKAG